MKVKQIQRVALALGVLSSSLLIACSKDDNMGAAPKKSGMATVKIENVSMPKKFNQSGMFESKNKGAIMPGESVSISFSAGNGQALMFAMMYGDSKDWFFASKQPGITLYKGGKAVEGDVTSEVKLWDNGTKEGKTDKAENKNIMEVPSVNVDQLVRLNLKYDAKTSKFTLTITNTSKGTGHETPFSPGVWAVSNYDGKNLLEKTPFFMPMQKTNAEITDLAQMGKTDKLLAKVKGETGLFTGVSPLMVVVYKGDKNPIFEVGKKDAGMGLKDIAQMGKADKLIAALKKNKAVKNVYIAGSMPLGPTASTMVSVPVEQGYSIAYVTMYGFSNDWFYANEKGIPVTFKGDVTAQTALFDSGTGVDQFPGAGNKQALFSGTPDMENNNIMKVDEKAYGIPMVKNMIKITIQ